MDAGFGEKHLCDAKMLLIQLELLFFLNLNLD